MKNYPIKVNDDKKNIFSGHIKLGGVNPSGERISFTNYYMEKNGEPFLVCAVNSISPGMMKPTGKMRLLR